MQYWQTKNNACSMDQNLHILLVCLLVFMTITRLQSTKGIWTTANCNHSVILLSWTNLLQALFFGHVQTELDTELGGLFFLYGNYSTSTSIRKPPAMFSMRRKPEERTAWEKKIERPRVRGRVARPREGGGARTRRRLARVCNKYSIPRVEISPDLYSIPWGASCSNQFLHGTSV